MAQVSSQEKGGPKKSSVSGHPKPPLIYEVVYPFDAQHRGVLTTQPGDKIKVETLPTKGLKWMSGHLGGKTGLFYLPFVREWGTEELDPPSGNLPSENPSSGNPSSENPSSGNPPSENPSSGKPSSGNSPSGNPPPGNPIGHKVTFMDSLYLAKEKPGEDFECIICKNLADDPHQSKCCGHTMCYSCATRWKSSNDTCPQCRRGPLDLAVDTRTKRHISSLTVHCPHYEKACSWEGNLGHVKSHLIENCEFGEINCPINGCGAKFQRRHVNRHVASQCKFRHVSCPCCGTTKRNPSAPGAKPLTYKYLLEKHHKTCPEWPVLCSNKTCKADNLKRSTLRNHLQKSCQEQVISCQFSEIGCGVKEKRSKMVEHVQMSSGAHQMALMQEYIKLKKENAGTRGLLKDIMDDYKKLKGEQAKTLQLFQSLQKDHNALQEEHKKLKEELVGVQPEYVESYQDDEYGESNEDDDDELWNSHNELWNSHNELMESHMKLKEDQEGERSRVEANYDQLLKDQLALRGELGQLKEKRVRSFVKRFLMTLMITSSIIYSSSSFHVIYVILILLFLWH